MDFNIKIKKLTIARQKNFIFGRRNKLTIKSEGNLSNINLCNFLKFQIPIMHREFSKKISQNEDYMRIYCNDWFNTFHYACRQRYSCSNPQTKNIESIPLEIK